MARTSTRTARTTSTTIAPRTTSTGIGFHRTTTVAPRQHRALATPEQAATAGASALRHLAADLITARTRKDRAAWTTLASLATSITGIRGRDLGLAADTACDAVALGAYTLAQTRLAYADYLATGDARSF